MSPLVVVSWFPQDQAHTFYVVKGLIALVATVLVVVHMSATWKHVGAWPQRLRYLSLLGLIALVAAASPEQAADGIPVSYRNLGGMALAVLVVITMLLSIRADRRR